MDLFPILGLIPDFLGLIPLFFILGLIPLGLIPFEFLGLIP